MVIICCRRVIPHRKKFTLPKFVALPDSPDLLDLATIFKSHHSLTFKFIGSNWTLINNVSIVPRNSVISIHLLVCKRSGILHISLLEDALIPSAIGRVESPRKAANLLPCVHVNDFTVNHGTIFEPACIFGGVVSSCRSCLRQRQLTLSMSSAIAINLAFVSAAVTVRNTVGLFQVFEFSVVHVPIFSLLLGLHLLLLSSELSLLCLNHLSCNCKFNY